MRADKSEVESALAEAKSTLGGSDPSTSDLNAAKDKLTAASHKLAEAVYKANAASGTTAPTDGDAAAAGTADEAKKDEGVIDAEYVDAEK